MIAAASSHALPYAGGTFHAALGSPPYWGGVRIYSGPQVRLWPAISYPPMPGLPPVEIPAQAVPLGHEPDPFAYVGHLLMVYREVRRTMRPEAVLGVNLGDCSSTGKGLRDLGEKQLLLMPWRLALAMQADGWILRSRMPGGVEIEPDILWKKNSTMPESVRDRPTVDFEDVLLFSQASRYYWDQEAGREANAASDGGRKTTPWEPPGQQPHGGPSSTLRDRDSGRNMRAAWTINPEPTDEEHYAAWPVELAARLIRVTTSERGCCPECGAPWERVVEKPQPPESLRRSADPQKMAFHTQAVKGGGGAIDAWYKANPSKTTGWRATCPHEAEPVPCLVLDPFAGLGRTWEAARETGRRFAGADLSLEYCWTARSRNVLEAAARRRAAEAKRPRTITGPLFEANPL